MEQILSHTAQQNHNDDMRNDSFPFYTLFALYIVLLFYVVFKIIQLQYKTRPNKVIFYYYVNLWIMLITRSIYLADTFSPYPYLVYYTFKSLPVVLVFGAGTIFAYLLRKLHLLFQEATCDLSRPDRKVLMRKAKFHILWSNLIYYILYLTYFIMAASEKVDQKLVWVCIYSTQIVFMLIIFTWWVIRTHQLRTYLKRAGIESPLRLKIVSYLFSSAMLARACADTLFLATWEEKQHGRNMTWGWWWQAVLAVIYICLEIIPLFTVLFVIKFRSDLQEEEYTNSSLYYNPYDYTTIGDLRSSTRSLKTIVAAD